MREVPIIGVSVPRRGGRVAWWLIARAVVRAGGWPVALRPRAVVPGLDGLVLSGGGDIDSGELSDDLRAAWSRRDGTGVEAALMVLRRFFARKAGDTPRRDRERDAFERALLAESLRRARPVFGICRGAQLINLAFGGTIADVPVVTGDESILHTAFPRKTVRVLRGSRLRRLVGRDELRVNALHHQTILKTGERLRVTATDENRLVQALESTSGGWVVGVQWHPEFLVRSRSQLALFEGLVSAARFTHCARG